jgi:hypothetical protein
VHCVHKPNWKNLPLQIEKFFSFRKQDSCCLSVSLFGYDENWVGSLLCKWLDPRLKEKSYLPSFSLSEGIIGWNFFHSKIFDNQLG